MEREKTRNKNEIKFFDKITLTVVGNFVVIVQIVALWIAVGYGVKLECLPDGGELTKTKHVQ